MFVTFYSYKGGVGRSSALINTAYYLAQSGRDVCLIDFDLEAPGLHKMPCFSQTDNKNQVGLIDYITDYVEKKEIIDVKDYLINTQIEVTNKDVKIDKKKSRLSLLKAGNLHKKYSEKLSKINWGELYQDYYGYYLFEILKKQLKDDLKFDYIFIDSRTGFNDVSGICTIQIPDTIVLVFGLNEQNLEGMESIYKSIKDKNIIPVVSPLNEVSINDIDQKVKRIESFMGNKNPINAISYSSLLANKESIVFEHKYKHLIALTNQYVSLAETIASKNPLDKNQLRSSLTKDINDVSKSNELQKKSENILKMNPLSIDYFHHSLIMYNSRQFSDAKSHIEKAIKIIPENIDYLLLDLFISFNLKENIEDKIKNLKKIYPNNQELIRNIIEIYISEKKFQQAKLEIIKYTNIFNEISKKSSNKIRKEMENKIIDLLPIISYHEEKYDEYIEQQNINDNSSMEDFYNISKAYYQILEYDNSLKNIDLALKSEPDNQELNIFKAGILIKLGYYDDAKNIYDETFKDNKHSPIYNYSLACLFFDKTEETKAIPYIEEAIKFSPYNVEYHLVNLSIRFNLQQKEKITEIISTLEYLILINQNKNQNIPKLIEILVSLDYYDKDKARFYYDLLKKLDISFESNRNLYNDDNSKKIKLGLAKSSILLKEYNKAIDYYLDGEITRKHIDYEEYFNCAMAYLFLNDKDKAISNFRKSLKRTKKLINSSNLMARANYLICYAIALYYTDKKDESINTIESCLKFVYSNINIKYIFSPEEYKLIERDKFIELCNKILNRIKENKNPFDFVLPKIF